jgi:membrane-bound metal-dependent hydrolase YbcI (DUF457 family)
MLTALLTHPKRREERAKLLAGFVSNLGAAAIVTGFVGPLLSGRFDWLSAAAGVAIGICLHLFGQSVLHYFVETPRSAS